MRNFVHRETKWVENSHCNLQGSCYEHGGLTGSTFRLHCSLGHLGSDNLKKLCMGERLEDALKVIELMDKQGVPLPRDIIYSLLQGCARKKDLAVVRRMHSLLVSSGLISVVCLVDHLIRLFGSCGSLVEANRVFCEVRKPTLYTWNAIISTHAKFGTGKTALELYHRMQEEGTKPDRYIFSCVLKACGSIKAIKQGMLIHNQITLNELELDVVLGNTLINMYANCGNMEDAHKVFEVLSNRDVVSWGTMIAGYAQHGHSLPALGLFYRMEQESIQPTKVTFLCTLKACNSIGAVGHGRLIHSHIMKSGFETDVVVGSTLVDMYAKCGSLEDAHCALEELQNRNVVSWGAIIAGYAHHGQSVTALKLFEKMQQEGTKPSKVTFLSALKACGSMGAIVQGRLIHDQFIASGFEPDVLVGSALVDMYAKCGYIDEARTVFDKLQNRDVVLWGAMIAGYAQHGLGFLALECFERMQQQNIKPSQVTFLCTLKACTTIEALEQGKMIHDQIIRTGLDLDVVVASTLVDMYAKCKSVEEARTLFDKLARPDAVSWGAMISGYAQHGQGPVALQLFQKMQSENIKPDKFVYSCILKACGSVGAIREGRLIHDMVVRSGLGSDIVIWNSLIDMFAKCGSLEEAHKVFDKLPDRDAVSWGTMIAGYAQHGHGLCALELLEDMYRDCIKPDKPIFVCTLKACGSIQAIEQGRLIYNEIVSSEMEVDVVVQSSLMDMYANCGSLNEARKLFDDLPNPNVVSCDVMIAGYVEHGKSICALEIFEKMQQQGMVPDQVTFLCILKACGSVGAIEQGRLVHDRIIRMGAKSHLVIESTLVDMYAKCGKLEEAHKVLNDMPIRNVVSWGAMIAGYAQCGNCCSVWQCLHAMKQQGVAPNEAVFTNILTACSHASLLEEGHQFFKSMKDDHSITPSIQHYSCMIDLLGRAGCLKEAEDLLQTMPLPPNIIVWTSLLMSCRTYGNMLLGMHCFHQVVSLNPSDASGYVLMSNIYADAHMWEDVDKLHGLRNHAGAPRKPGKAWIEVSNKAHEFIVAGKGHPQSDSVYARLRTLSLYLKEEGYIPHLHLVSELLSQEYEIDALWAL